MTANNQDIIAFLNHMPPEMKQEAIRNIEALRGISICEYKAQQIAAAELFLVDVQANPGNYTEDDVDKKRVQLLRDFKIAKDLDRRFGLVKWFISQRSLVTADIDGNPEQKYGNLTFDEFMKTKKPLK